MPSNWIPRNVEQVNEIDAEVERVMALKEWQRKSVLADQPVTPVQPPEWQPANQWQRITPEVPVTEQASRPFRQSPSPIPPAAGQAAPPLAPPFETTVQAEVTQTPSRELEQPKTQYDEVWEAPARATELAGEAVAKGITKVKPLVSVLQWASPAFSWLRENIELPWAAVVTSAFSPTLPAKTGESWMAREKREYEAWKAPTYVKGVVEFLNPVYMIPVGGWVGKGLRAISIGTKAARVIAPVAKAAEFILPNSTVMEKMFFKGDVYRRMADWGKNIKGWKGFVQSIGGVAAFADDIGDVEFKLDPTLRQMYGVSKTTGVKIPVDKHVTTELVKYRITADYAKAAEGLNLPHIQAYGDATKLLSLDAKGRVGIATPKPGNQMGNGLSDVLEHPGAYVFASPRAEQMVKDVGDYLDKLNKFRVENGLTPYKDIKFHRMVKGKTTPQGYEASEYGSKWELERHYPTWEVGLTAGIDYDTDIIKSLTATTNHAYRQVARKRFVDAIKPYGMTLGEKVAAIDPQLMAQIDPLVKRISAAKNVDTQLRIFSSRGGSYIPGSTLEKIRRELPQVASRIDTALAMKPDYAKKIIGNVAKEVQAVMKLKPKQLEIAVANAAWQRMQRVLTQPNQVIGKFEKITDWALGDIDEALGQLGVNQKQRVKAIENAYKAVYQSREDFVSEEIKKIRSEMEAVIDNTKSQLAPLKGQYKEIRRRYAGTGQILGTGEAKFRFFPGLDDRIFPRDVVKLVEKQFSDQGQDWLRATQGISGASRMLTASLDVSAGFIQGLAVLGRNPAAWAKAIGRQFQFLIAPESYYKWLDEPVNTAIRAERALYGSASSTFEFFEVMRPMREVAAKIPVVGKGISKGLQQTFGRAEVAFTGFGEVARTEMWKAMKKPNMTAEQLQDLSRTIDRMTGVMSMEQLAIGRSQQEFENAFMFFAPRYTRAGMSLVADVFKGGVAGNEARKTLASMMAGGVAMYYGVAKAVGQEPNLDPRSAKFLTIKVGDEFVGVGGIFYAMARLSGGMAGAVESAIVEGDINKLAPINPLNLSRTDNEFLKFMYGRTAPLTGTLYSTIVEHKNFLGEPFESPADYGRFMLDKVIPISWQPVMPWSKDKESSVPVFAAQLTGARAFPKSAFVLQEEARELEAQTQYGKTYDDLDMRQKRTINQTATVQKYQAEIDQQTTLRGDALSRAFLDRRHEIELARDMHESYVMQLQAAIDAGVISGYEFREYVKELGTGYRSTLEHINADPRYTEVLQQLENPRQKVSRNALWELAYDEIMDATASNAFEDKYGLFQYDSYYEYLDKLKAKYGEQNVKDAMEYMAERYVNYPPMYKEYAKAKEILRPYWQVQDEVETMYGKPETASQVKRQDALISKIRKRMRQSNPEMERYYQLFYVRPEA